MTRRELREQIFLVLFRIEFYDKDELNEQLELVLDDLDQNDKKSILYIKNKVADIIEHLDEIDQKINEVSKGWKIARMGKVDLTLIRLSVYEMKFEEDIPVGVAINEAVELAKQYGTDDSSSFVNGILAKLV